MVFLLFALSMNSLLTSGVRGEGRMFWIIFILLTLMLLGLRAAQITVGITILAISVVGWAVVTQRFTLTEPYDQLNASSWIVGTVVMLLTVVLLMLGVTLLQREFHGCPKAGKVGHGRGAARQGAAGKPRFRAHARAGPGCGCRAQCVTIA